MNRELLEKPFPVDRIKTRKGGFGQGACTYIEGHEIVRRLNEAFDGAWSFQVAEYRIEAREVIVLGRVIADGVEKMAFGGAAITTGRDSGEAVAVADDLKAAATDALKKAAQLLGVGLYLHVEAEQPVALAETAQGASAASQAAQPAQAAPQAQGGERLTQKQLQAIWSMGRKLGLGADAVRQRAVELFGAEPEQLDRADASILITKLGEEIERRRAA
ncbi:MAG: Rad52/Rad22 family DNA repair protein [Deltaproteobacteria bacterium]|nr:Rad52/Rad22 family DNA repair protein [Deltaproteobacteria bacterium]